jgi:hypothetical protein
LSFVVVKRFLGERVGVLGFCYVAVKEEAEGTEIRNEDDDGRLGGIPSSIVGGDYQVVSFGGEGEMAGMRGRRRGGTR